MNNYINFDRRTDALASLNNFCRCMECVSQDEMQWKFALIAIHNALQGYICISLLNGNSFRTWSENNFKKWMKAYENGNEKKLSKLDFFMDLFDKVFPRDEDINRKYINWLNDTRNEFIHFNSDGFSLCKESAILASIEAIKAIKLAPEKAAGIFFYEPEDEEAYNEACERAEALLQRRPT